MAQPLVSVVVPTYNRFEWLPTAIVYYDFALRLAANTPGCAVDHVLAEIWIHEARTTTVSGRFDGDRGKPITYRKASRALPDPELRRIARRQMRAHLRALARRAIRDGAVGEIVRLFRSLRHL